MDKQLVIRISRTPSKKDKLYSRSRQSFLKYFAYLFRRRVAEGEKSVAV